MLFFRQRVLIIFLYVIVGCLNTTTIVARQFIDFEHISFKEGLPGSNIRFTFQDEMGYLWFGVEAVGLCKYNGTQFQVHEVEPDDANSLSNSFIKNIVSYKRDLWVATEDGLNLYLRDKDIFYQFFPENIDLSDNVINYLLFDNKGDLLIGTNKGLDVLSPENLRDIYSQIENNNDPKLPKGAITKYFSNDTIVQKYGELGVMCLYEDSGKNIWIGTDQGVFLMDANGHLLKHLRNDPGDPSSLIHNLVRFIHAYDSNKILIGTDRGICLYDVTNGEFEPDIYPEVTRLRLEHKGYYSFLKDSDGTEWYGMSGSGILMVDKSIPGQSDVVHIKEGENGLLSRTIRHIFEDNSGQIWISTKFGGIHIFQKHQDVFQTYTIDNVNYVKNRKDDKYVLSLFVDNKENIWVGTKFGGLLKFDYNTNSYESYWIDLYLKNEGYSNRIEYVFQDKQGNIWIGTPNGINQVDVETKKITLFPFYPTYSMCEDSKGNLWVGTTKGVYLFDRDNNSYIKPGYDYSFFQDSSLNIYAIYEDSKSNIWFGTFENGIYAYNLHTGKLRFYSSTQKAPCNISGNMVRSVFEDKNGTIWIGTKHNGLNYMPDSVNSFSILSKSDGIASNTIYAIQDDNHGNLWLSTHHGLSFIDIKTGEITNFDASHGLQGNIFENNACAKTKNGLMLFGGNNGFNIFYPDSLKITKEAAPLTIDALKVNNENYMVDFAKDTVIYLKYYQNYIDFEFSLLNYHTPFKNYYRYKLEGVDREWIEADSRNFVSYSDLKNGEYVFNLQAFTSDRNVISEPLAITLIIKPPFWKTTIAYFIYIIIVSLSFIGIYYFATNRANYKHRLSESKKAIQHNMEINEAKLRFFTNISHELQSPLALISVPAEKLSYSSNLTPQEKSYVDLIQKNSYRLKRLVDQLMYFRKAQKEVATLKAMKGDIISFLQEITAPFQLYAQQKELDFRLTFSEERMEMWFDPDKMEKIISNLLMNAFKYTPEGGSVEVSIVAGEHNLLGQNKAIKPKELNKTVTIRVKDTGKGIPKNELKNIFNRFYTSSKDSTISGTGIGLELTKTLVELHGGAIAVDSKEDEGSTFIITLFRESKHLKKSNISDEVIVAENYISDFDYGKMLAESSKRKENTGHSKNDKNKPLILVAEDNDDLRKFLGENLELYYNTILVDDGEKAYNEALNKVPDLIISDVVMPKMDGVELCKNIKSNTITSHIPLILLTRKILIEEKIEGLQTGADDYIEKPFNLQYLLMRVNNLLATINKIKEQTRIELTDGRIEILDVSVYDKKLLNRCKEAILKNISNPEFGVEELGRIVGMSRSQLYRKLIALTGQGPNEMIYSSRLREAKNYLLMDKYSIMDVAHMSGFKSSNSFSTVFKKNFGFSPKEFVDKHK